MTFFLYFYFYDLFILSVLYDYTILTMEGAFSDVDFYS
jgi:hypothetical protein